MTVVYNQSEQTFKASEFLWGKRQLVDAIVREALISQTEAFVDMIVDGQADMSERSAALSRSGIQDTLRGVKESAGEFLNDLLADIKIAIEERLNAAQYGAAVTGIKYDLAGDVTDVEVDVTVSFEK